MKSVIYILFKVQKLDNDDDLSDLLTELDETPTLQSLAINTLKPKPFNSPISAKLAEKNYMKSLATRKTTPQAITTPKKPKILVLQEIKDTQNVLSELPDPFESQESQLTENGTQSLSEETQIQEDPSQNQKENGVDLMITEDCFNDDLDMSQIAPENEEQKIWDSLDATEVLKEWDSNLQEAPITEPISSDVPLVDIGGKKVFRFFWWDAFEDASKQPGVVFLFGKTYHEKIKSYVSCCVSVRNIDRKLFFLPRVTVI